MKKIDDCFLLNDGNKIPCIGFGTWKINPGQETYDCVLKALDCGYRHIDTAFIYKNEKSVGEAVKDSKIDRKDIFVTTKLWGTERGYKTAIQGFERSLSTLGTDYIDLFLIHWPANAKNYQNWQQINLDTWKAFEDIKASGRVKSIGLSNFLPHHMQIILENCKVKPSVNQIEMNPGYVQRETVKFCKDNHILVEGYRPLGRGDALNNPEIIELAQKYSKTPAQICIKWSLQNSVLPLPKSVRFDRIEQNANVFDFELQSEDMEKLNSLPTFAFGGQHPDEMNF